MTFGVFSPSTEAEPGESFWLGVQSGTGTFLESRVQSGTGTFLESRTGTDCGGWSFVGFGAFGVC